MASDKPVAIHHPITLVFKLATLPFIRTFAADNWSLPGVEMERRQHVQGLSQRLTPTLRNPLEIRIIARNSPGPASCQAILFIAVKVKGRSDGQVCLERGVEADQQQFYRFRETHCRIVGPHKNGAAILGFPDLEKWRVLICFDEVPLGVNHE